MTKFLLPVLFVFFFILESLFVQLLPGEVLNSDRIFVPHFLLVAIILLTIYGSRKLGLLYGLIFGLLFDIVYTEVIGIYLFLFPLIAYIVSKMMKVLQANVFIVLFVVIAGVALAELGVYEMNYLIHITNMGFAHFIEFRLLPTLLLNLAFVIIAMYPLKRNFETITEQSGIN
jgi:rod shape-determining protein MreD